MRALLPVLAIAELSEGWGRVTEVDRRTQLRGSEEQRRLSPEVPVPGCAPVTVDCGEDCELSGVYECTSYFNNRGWWVKGGVSFQNTTPHGNTTHTEMFQIWWNSDYLGASWRIGYTHHHWFVNSDPHDWGETKWKPQKIGGPDWPPNFASQMAKGDVPSLRIIPSSTSTEHDFMEYIRYYYYYAVMMSLVAASCIVGKNYFAKRKKHALDSGHGSAPKNVAIKRSVEESVSTLKQHEVEVSGEQNGYVYVFDGNDGTTDDYTYIVIQVRYCRVGPPLLPIYEADGSLRWEVSA